MQTLKVGLQKGTSNANISCVKQFDDLLKGSSPEIGLICRIDPELAVCALTMLFLEYLEFTNTKQTMNERQIGMTIELMLEAHPHMRLEDFKFFFRKCMKGEFGSNYNRVDGPTILIWLKEFDDELGEAFAQKRQEEHERIKNDSKDDDISQCSGCPVEVQRSINKFLHGIECTDAELDKHKSNKRMADAIKREVHIKYLPMYNVDPDTADRLIDEEINKRLTENNLKEFI